MAGLEPAEYEELTYQARRLSLLDPLLPEERRDDALAVHPLVAELLREGVDEEEIVERMTAWFLPRIQVAEGDDEAQGWRVREAQAEHEALLHWLERAPPGRWGEIQRRGSMMAVRSGPFHAWMRFYERALGARRDPEEQSNLLFTLGHVCRRAGELERTLEVAQQKIEVDAKRGAERGVALA